MSYFKQNVNPSKKVGMDGGFPWAGRAASRDFPRALPSANPSEQPCQPSENPFHTSSFTWINPYYFKQNILVGFLHNSFGTLEFPDCEILVGVRLHGKLRWVNMEKNIVLIVVRSAESHDIGCCRINKERSRPCTLGRPIGIRPCTLGRQIRIRPCILGRPKRDFCFKFYSQFHF